MTITTSDLRPSRSKRSRALLPAVAGMTLLAGCATTKVGDFAMSEARSAAPAAIVVAVELADGLWGDDDAMRAAAGLHRDLEHRLAKEGITVHTGEPTHPGAAVMRVRIDEADRGNAVKRFVVGFGSGNSRLRTTIALEVAGERDPALRFTSRNASFPRPGLVMPVGIAGASGKTGTLPISAGLGLLSVTRSGLDADVRNTARRIVAETKEYYVRVGWRWPRS